MQWIKNSQLNLNKNSLEDITVKLVKNMTDSKLLNMYYFLTEDDNLDHDKFGVYILGLQNPIFLWRTVFGTPKGMLPGLFPLKELPRIHYTVGLSPTEFQSLSWTHPNRVGRGDYPPSSHTTARAVPQTAVWLFKDVPMPCTIYS